jgi:hypothetical protein
MGMLFAGQGLMAVSEVEEMGSSKIAALRFPKNVC